MTESKSKRVSWTQQEDDCLEELAGNCPTAMVLEKFREFGAANGWPHRSDRAIIVHGIKKGLSFRCCGDMITLAYAAKLCDRSEKTFYYWRRCKKRFPATKIGGQWFVSRASLRKWAMANPSLFAEIPESSLVMLLEDEALANFISKNHKKRRYRARRIREVDSGKIFPSMTSAAKEAYVTIGAISLGIKQRRPVCGKLYEEVA